MRLRKLWVALSLAMMGGCALVFSYGDYKDGATSGGGQNAGGSTSSGMGGMGGMAGTTSSGSAGSTSSGGGTGGTSGQPCLVVQACPEPAAADKCSIRACDGECKIVSAPVGLAPRQVDGDCYTAYCNAAGNINELVDITDAPSDDNECTEDICDMNGNPAHPNLPMTFPCGNNLQCNGMGKCAGCGVDGSLCNTTNVPCQSWACTANTCEGTNLSDGLECNCVDGHLVATCQAGICQAMSPTVCPKGCHATGVFCSPSPCTATNCAPSTECQPNGMCQDCTTCAEWAVALTPIASTLFCPGSATPANDLVMCACGSCPPCLGTILCDPNASPLTVECANCIANSCDIQKSACETTEP